MVMQVRRTPTPNNPPTGLAEGQLSVGMADQPPRLWCGVPTSIDPAGFVLLNPRSPQTTSSVTPPANPVTGDLWFDLSQDPAALMVWDGSTWQPATPADIQEAYLPLTGGNLSGPLNIVPSVSSFVPLYIPIANTLGGSIVAFGGIQGGTLWSQGDSNCVGAFNGAAMNLSGAATCLNLTASGTVQAGTIWSTGTITAQGQITGTNIALSGNLNALGITLSGNIQATNATINAATLSLSASATCVNLTAGNQVEAPYILATNSGWQPGGGLWNDSSDARIKAIDGDYETGLAAIEALRPIRYRFKGNERNAMGQCLHRQAAAEGKPFVGLTGQNLEAVMPETVWREKGSIDGVETGILTANQGALVYALINAVKELSARVRELEGARS